jgi:3-carboxy-cis,cis-muconate cycloisomerase
MTNSLFGGLFARGRVAAELSDRAFVRAMLDTEVAFAEALADAGLAPTATAAQIKAAADRVADAGLSSLSQGSGESGTPVPAMLVLLRATLEDDPASQALHRGLTSQDVIDTAMMLVARRALVPLLADLGRAADRCAELALEHGGTVEAGRTLLQHAAAVTFGLKAAGWLSGLDDSRSDLAAIRQTELAAQVGGAAGTLSGLDGSGIELAGAVARRLELAEPVLPWHTIRVRPARLACALAVTCGVIAKIGRDVTLLAQTEVAEVRTAVSGGSSAMAHKRNPVEAIAMLACAKRAPGLLATIIACMEQEHERAAGAWQAEWEPMLQLLELTGSASSVLAEMLTGLEVDAERMASNLALSGDLDDDIGAAEQLVARALAARRGASGGAASG